MNDFVSTESGGILNLLDVYAVGVNNDEQSGKPCVQVRAIGHKDAVRVASYNTWSEACKAERKLSKRVYWAQGRIK